MEQNNIDKLFKDKLGAEKVEFNPAAWTAAEELIAQQTAQTAWYANKTVWSVLALLFITIGGTTWFFSGSESNLTQNIASTQPTAAPAVEVSSSSNQNTKVTTLQMTNAVDPAQFHSGTVKDVVGTDVNNVPSEDFDTQATTVDRSSENEEPTNNTLPPVSDNTQASQMDPDLADQPQEASSPPSVRGQMTKGSRLHSSFEMNLVEREVEKVPMADLLRTEELEDKADFTQPVELPLNDRGLSILRNFDIRLVTGMGAAGGFKNPSDDSPTQFGYRPTAGLNVGYIVNSEFSFDVNVLYSMRTGLSQEAIVLDPVLANNTTQTLSLHYLDVPFYLNYHWDRHAVQLGMQYSYLITTRSQEIAGTDQGNKSWGSNSYYKNSDLSGVLGYSFMINENLNIGARYNYGLFDITGSQPSTWETNDRNHHFSILLEYKLSKY